MKISLIKACADSDFKTYKKSRGGFPQNIFALASATPEGIDIELTDETVSRKVDYYTDADLIVIMFSTPDAIRAYHHAAEFRRRGKTVILGGLHPTFMSDEALDYCDSVIIGEAENVWYDILKDFHTDSLKLTYKSKKPFNLINMKPYRNDLCKLEDYDWVSTVLVSRGCHFKCDFCTVNKFFHAHQYRPVEHVIDEIKSSQTDFIELKADNLTIDREYCLELFRAIKPLDIKWSTSADIMLAQDEELLAAAAESGLNYLLLGIETPSETALKNACKGFVKRDQIGSAINDFHSHGIIVDASALFGFDSHTPDIFEETLNFFEEIEVDVCDSVILIPFPGTELFKRMDNEGRIRTRNWSLYDGSHAVFHPLGMTARELEEGAYWFYQEWNSGKRKRGRKKRQSLQLGRQNANYIARNF